MTPHRPDGIPRFDPATEAELDAAAEITPEDIARAQETWRSTASPASRDLLDATPAPAVDLEQPATLVYADLGREYRGEYETGWGAITAGAWMLHLGKGTPTRIVLRDGGQVEADRIRAEYERMEARKAFG